MLALIYPAALVACIHAGGDWLWALVLINLVLVPMLDHAIHAVAPEWHPSVDLQKILFSETAFCLYAAAQVGALLYALHAATQDLTGLELWALVSSTGIMTGTAGITAAHELIHRRSASLRALGLGLLATVLYMHFRIQHTLGHHRRVGTDLDRGSARMGESFPAFFGRALIGGIADAWNLECARLAKHGIAALSPSNRMLQYLAIQVAILAILAIVLGRMGVAFFVLQSLMAVHLLEAVNYVQHYGLRRSVSGDRVQPFSEKDAWDSDYRISELLIFNLAKHSDHHGNPGASCDELVVSAGSRRLPFSFFLMVFLALFPPIWRRVMDPLLAEPASTPLPESV